MCVMGVSSVPLHKAFAEGYAPPTQYKVLGSQGQPQGEVTVGLKFTPKVKYLVLESFLSSFHSHVLILEYCWLFFCSCR